MNGIICFAEALPLVMSGHRGCRWPHEAIKTCDFWNIVVCIALEVKGDRLGSEVGRFIVGRTQSFQSTRGSLGVLTNGGARLYQRG